MPGESTLAPRFSNATDFSSYASKDRVLGTYGSRVALTTAEDDDGGSQRLEIGGFHLRKLAVMLTTTMVVKGYSDGVYSLESTAIERTREYGLSAADLLDAKSPR